MMAGIEQMIGTIEQVRQVLSVRAFFEGSVYHSVRSELYPSENSTRRSSRDALSSQFIATPQVPTVRTVSVDSRQIMRGEGCLFFALVSPSGDGHRYIAEAYARGVRYFVVSEMARAWEECFADACFLLVADTLRSLQALAGWYRRQCRATYTFALIGSNGKTIVKEMLATLLGSEDFWLYRSPGSYNSQVGVALSLLSMPRGANYAFIEAGISEPREMGYLAEMICPDEVIMTHFGSAHSAGFESLEALYAEKLSILHNPSVKRLHYYASPEREGYIAELLARLAPKNISLHNAYSLRRRLEQQGTNLHPYEVLVAEYLGQLGGVDHLMTQNISLALGVVATALPQHFEGACSRVAELSPLPMRMALSENAQGNILINDSYSNDLDALRQAILCLRQRGGDTMVLGPIEQSALSLWEIQDEVLRLCEEAGLSRVYLLAWGAELSWQRQSVGTDFILVKDSQSLLQQYHQELLATPVLLIKGPRRMQLEHLVQRLSLREHDTQLSVDLTALSHNLAYYRSLLPRPASLICMIKADAYGLGAVPIARCLASSGHIEYLAVAVADEGKTLRREGIDSPIIVMNPQGDSLDSLMSYGLEAEVYSMQMLHRFARAYGEGQLIPLHLKVDSGMHRLGFAKEDLPQIVSVIEQYKLPISTVFSHLAGADEECLDNFTAKQAEYLQDFYNELCQALSAQTEYPHLLPRLHLLNTAGLERFSQNYAFDGARLGIGLYGFSPSGRSEVQEVVHLSTRILQVKRVPAGEGVGYGCRQSAKQERCIAIIPIGYADGFARCYGNGRWSVEVGAVLCPTVGNICMDACMIDVTAVEGVKAGDEVVIFGSELTPLAAMAACRGTIPYEVLTSISPRVARVYY